MADNVTTIKDPTVYVKPGKIFKNFLSENEMFLKNAYEVPDNIKKIMNNEEANLAESDLSWINDFLINQRNENDSELLTGKQLDMEIEKMLSSNFSNINMAEILAEKNKNLPYLHDLMKESELILPKNEVIQRNPVLAERIERLKKEQEEREYKAMTQNVDTSKKHFPEDSISYHMNMMNRHLIAVAQFLVSVAAGFAFGFLGVELIIGDLNFSVRLLLGIACAIIIAVAEFYFLAKHLNEEDKRAQTTKERTYLPGKEANKKFHKD